MATEAPINATPAHNLSQSSQIEAKGLTSADLPSPPRGDVKAILNYFTPPDSGEAPFNFVEPQPEGHIQRNYTDQDHEVVIHDIRGHESEYTLDKDAFQVIGNVPDSAETAWSDDESIQRNYYPEVERLLLDHVAGSSKIFLFDHTIRRNTGTRGPVTRTHIDQTAEAARKRVQTHLPDEAETLLQGRYRIINVWRPLNGPVYAHPLGFASSSTVDDKDLVPIEHRYPDRLGWTAGVVYNPGQKWHYLSGMRNDERLFLECFDSEALKEGTKIQGGRVPHSAFVDPRSPGKSPGRESIEVRALVFGP